MNEQVKTEIDKLLADSTDAYRQGNLRKSTGLLEHAWDLLPGEKEMQEQSFYIAKYLVQLFLETKNAEKAKEWADILQHCDLDRFDSGDREFWAGRAALAINDKETARVYFSISNKKSKGRHFQGDNKKYLTIL